MHFLVLKENLNKCLSILIRNIATGSQIPILSNILIKAKDKTITLSATNMEIGIVYTLLADVKKKGEVTIPGKMFTDFINFLPPEKIEFILENTNLKVTTKKNIASFATSSTSDFPTFPKIDKHQYLLSLKKLKDAIVRTAFSASTDEGRPVLTGVKLTMSNGKTRLVATDGYRLSVEEVATSEKKEELEVLIPAKTLTEVLKISQESQADEVGFSVIKDKNQACFSLPNIHVFTRILEGDFPSVEKIIPSGFKTRVILDRNQFVHSVKTISLFARGAANIIKINIGKKGLRLSAATPQMGECEEFIEAKIEGKEGEIAFNYRFLLDLLNNYTDKSLVFESSGSLNPGVFKPLSSKYFYLHLIMPVRIQKE